MEEKRLLEQNQKMKEEFEAEKRKKEEKLEEVSLVSMVMSSDVIGGNDAAKAKKRRATARVRRSETR